MTEWTGTTLSIRLFAQDDATAIDPVMEDQTSRPPRFRAAEFFAGIGLVHLGLARHFDVVFANDIDVNKFDLYTKNFEAPHFVLGDIRALRGADVPNVDLATASFPCTDLSLAGNRAGLAGAESGLFWEFARVVEEMKPRPRTLLIENVLGFATSHAGRDLESAVGRLNELGYWVDPFVLDARWFVPQSRPRLFIVASNGPMLADDDRVSPLRPAWLRRFRQTHPNLKMASARLRLPTESTVKLDGIVERLSAQDSRWWTAERVGKFVSSLSPLQYARLTDMRSGAMVGWATAYRRTRGGRPVWEIRSDDISGCLRTARGGSSKQALVEAGCGEVRVRWMTATEYARLQGAPEYRLDDVRENQALFGFGDAVCAPAITWIADSYLVRLTDESKQVPQQLIHA